MNSVGKWTPLPHESPRVACYNKKQKKIERQSLMVGAFAL